MTPLQAQAMIIAVAVRNAMEDFHCEHVPNELMPELNRAVRAGVMEAPTLLDLAASDDPTLARGAQAALAFLQPPDYWEPPEPPAALEDALRRFGSL